MPDYTCKVVRVLWASDADKGGNRVEIRVVRWSDGPPVLEKRRIWNRDGEDRAQKMAGIDFDDLKVIAMHMDELAALLGGG